MSLKPNEVMGRKASRAQSDNDAPQQKMVSVAVLPPKLPPGMAPPTDVAVSGAVGWDDAINYQHNNPIVKPDENQSTAKKLWGKYGITAAREKRNPNTPNFTFRQVPYDVWRKHYAKDAEGNYRGTHAPAEDCLLKPEDVAKWRSADDQPKTYGDQYTRGSQALPVYADVGEQSQLPEYQAESDPAVPQPGEPVVDSKTGRTPSESSSNAVRDRNKSTGQVIADGKTAQQIIDEAKAREASKPKLSWQEKTKKAFEKALLAEGN